MKLNDSIFNSMTHSQWMSTILPKVHGSKNLHEATLTEPLDFFILLSSLHGHIGNPGQANYAAGCAYQVALAKYRNTIGLPAVAIDLGIVEDVGYVVETQDAGKKITVQGFKPISEVEMLALIELGIREPMKGHIITGLDSDMHISQLTEERGVPFFARDPALSHLDWLRPHRATTGKQTTADSPTSKSVSLRSQLALASTNDAAQGLILTALLKKLSKSLMMEVADLDAARPLSTYGIDSLVAVELKGWVQREIEVKLSVFDIIQATSINALVDKIADRTW
jgi:acyl carrier protein